MTNIIIPAKNQIRTGFSQFGHILLERFKPNHLKSLTFISARTRRMINTYHRQVAKIRTDKTPFIIILFDTHPIFDVVGLDFGQYGHSAIPFLLCRVKICFISKRLECLCRIFKRMLIFGMVGLGCMTACVTTSASFVGAAFWRVCFGIFEGCWNIVMYSVAGSIFPAARAMLNGLMMTFYSIGAYVGPTYYGWSLERTGDWSIGLTHMGFVTVIFGLLLIFGFKKKYTDTSTAIKRIHLVEAIRTVGFNKVVWLGVLIQILNIIPYWGFASMGPYLFMTYKGFSPTEAGSFFGAIYGIGGLSGVVLGFFADRFGRKPTIIFLSGLNALCAFLIFHVIPQTSIILYIVGGLMGIGLHAIYVLGYTIAQDGVSTSQIGLATGIVGASSYFLSFFSGPLMGFLTTTLGHVAALDIIVVAFEFCLFIVALLMKETQNHHLHEKTEA